MPDIEDAADTGLHPSESYSQWLTEPAEDCFARRLEDEFAGDCPGCDKPAYFCVCLA